MTVYVVTTGEDSACRIEGIFSTREGAERLRAEFRGEDADVEVYTVDEQADHARRTVYWCWMNANGDVYNQGQEERVVDSRFTEVWTSSHSFGSKSAVSPEHAAKLAAEARQAWLRRRAVEHGVYP